MSKTSKPKTKAKAKKNGGGVGYKLRQEFGDMPVIEGFAPLRLQPMQCDVETASPKDPRNCVYARTAARQYGATKVIFWKSFAYVDLVGPDGVRHVERFMIPKSTLNLIERFDRGEPLEIGRAFHLVVPPRNRTRKATNLRARARERTPDGRKVRAARNAKTKYKNAGVRVEREEARLQEVRADSNPQSPKVKFAVQRVTSAKVVLREAKSEFERRTKAADKVREKKPHVKPHQTKTFDMTVRNGRHEYNFARREAATTSSQNV